MTPPPEALAHAAGAVDRIASTAPDMRWVPPQRWHVTLAFLGEVERDRILRIEAALDEVAAEHPPLEDLRIEGAGSFQGALWLSIAPAGRHSPADRLARAVQRAMRAVGVPVERRPWRAHLTIARWGPAPERDRSARSARDALGDYSGPAFSIHRIALVHSVTGPHPAYSDVATFELCHVGNLGGSAERRTEPAPSRSPKV